MFHISPDQTQWFHLYRVQKTSPVMFVLFCCEEVNEAGNSSRFLDLRIVSSGFNTMGGSWCVEEWRPENREPRRLHEVPGTAGGNFISRPPRSTVSMKLNWRSRPRKNWHWLRSIDETLRNNLMALAPTLLPKMARDLIVGLGVNQSGIEFEDLHRLAHAQHRGHPGTATGFRNRADLRTGSRRRRSACRCDAPKSEGGLNSSS